MNAKREEAWPEKSIYRSIKILVSIEIKTDEKSNIMIDFAQPIFETVFGYSLETLPMPINNLISMYNNREDITDLYLAISTGRPKNCFINLTSQTGNVLSCYLSMVCSTYKQDEYIIMDTISNPREPKKFAVMTIRSASAVGNTRLIGIGIHEIQGVDLHTIENRIGNKRIEAIDNRIECGNDRPSKKKLKDISKNDNQLSISSQFSQYDPYSFESLSLDNHSSRIDELLVCSSISNTGNYSNNYFDINHSSASTNNCPSSSI